MQADKIRKDMAIEYLNSDYRVQLGTIYYVYRDGSVDILLPSGEIQNVEAAILRLQGDRAELPKGAAITMLPCSGCGCKLTCATAYPTTLHRGYGTCKLCHNKGKRELAASRREAEREARAGAK